MDARELFFKYFPLVKKHWLPLSLGILGLMFFIYGLIGSFMASRVGSEDIVFEANSSTEQNSQAKTILVDIEGSVVKPGVYKLPLESRIQDGLIAAGGLSSQADREYVAKNFNLATKLTDGAKIYVPNISEAVKGVAASNTSSDGIVTGTLININTSSESQLDSLPGVGPVTAQKIIAGRPYSSTDELLTRKMVGSKVFNQIKDKVSVY
jgi:competence protein ComEA